MMAGETVDYALRAAHWAGYELEDHQLVRLDVFHDWLGSEAIAAGGLGPNEANRLWSRHIGDALLFASGLEDVPDCVDAGSGVGLPGIPLAILSPGIRFRLVERSGRRCDLLRRVVSILDLDNCEVLHRELNQITEPTPALVSRAALPPRRLMIHVKRLLIPGGVAVIGLSRGHGVSVDVDVPEGWSAKVVTVPPDILDSPAKLLRIGAT